MEAPMRKLASIQHIKSLEPIVGADAIEKATVLGWELVVKKGEFNVGDPCVYCEIDCLMPERPEFDFLKPRGMRIRTVRLRGQFSQGICFPLSILPAGLNAIEGDDVTDALGITKYEPPIPANLAGKVKGGFPGFLPKTDETRVQVLQEVLDQFRGTICYLTEKLDGSSVTYYVKDGEFGVCSRNLELLETPDNSIWRVARELDVEAKLRSLNGDFALQGEIIGEGVQGNKYKLRGQTVRFFNLYDIAGYRHLDYAEYLRAMEAMQCASVPLLRDDYALSSDIPELVKLAMAPSRLNPAIPREGVVIRPLTEQRMAMAGLGRVSFKAINPEFLLKFE
jgi:RNA ligase (TIGR02306 family)